tara:strand:+ start:292 stop:960 length:669 start_codon:yes stop_codon:yes gene_type:complete
MFQEKTLIDKDYYSLGKVLEIHKFLWTFVTFGFTFIYGANTYRMYLMNALFSSYGLLWVLKSNIFYDVNFYTKKEFITNLSTSIINFSSVSVYFLFPYITATNNVEITLIDTCTSLILYNFGGFLHYGADCQKFYTLKYNKQLITDGFFSIIRHPNYAGEFLIWFSLIIISGKDKILSYIPLFWLTMATIFSGIPIKEKSLQKYDDYKKWEKNTNKLIPGIY